MRVGSSLHSWAEWRARHLMRLFGFFYRHGRTTTILMIVAILAMAALFLYSARHGEIENTRANALNLAQLLQEQTRAVFLTTDLTLRNIKARLERSAPPPAHDAAFRVYLRDLMMELPYVRALFVIGQDGFIIHDTDYPETPRIGLVDRPYFLVHRRDADIGPYVGEPLLSRSVGRWFVPLSRRINRADGTFSAVVVAAVEPGFFEHIYERLSLSENDSVALFHRDSTLIARAPAMPDLYGRKWPTGQVFREYLPQTPSGVLTGISFTDRTATIGYSAVEGFPLVVTTVLDQQFALAGWRGTAWVVGFSVLFIALLILLLAAALHRRRLEMELSQQRALMAHRLATVGQMADGVAHDFNNVLAIISASVELIRKRGPADALLQGVEQAVERGSGLSAGLLAYAKRQEHDRRVENPNDLLRSLAFIIRKLAGQGIEVKFRYSPGVGDCLVDRSRFDASVLNIVANAAHAMPDGGTITISTDSVAKGPEDRLRPGDYAHIRIADTGSGMDGETLARAFDPFFTTKSADGGTGLGLPQVRSFMQDMGGGVRIASEPGAGTLVDLYLPCVATGGAGGNRRG